MRLGDAPAAAAHQLECLGLALELGSIFEVAAAANLAARLSSLVGDWPTAARLETASEELLRTAGFSLYPSDRAVKDELLAVVAEHLSAEQLADAVQSGNGLGLLTVVEQSRRVLTAVASGAAPTACLRSVLKRAGAGTPAAGQCGPLCSCQRRRSVC